MDTEKLFKLYARFGAEPEELRNAQIKADADKVLETIGNIFRKTRVQRRHEIRTVEAVGEAEAYGDSQSPENSNDSA
jgi:hypothetical protein